MLRVAFNGVGLRARTLAVSSTLKPVENVVRSTTTSTTVSVMSSSLSSKGQCMMKPIQTMQMHSNSVPAEVQEDKIISEINEQIESKNHGRLFAVIHIAGRQFKITEEDVIVIRGHWAPDIGDRLRLEKVMLVGSSQFTLLGKPLLPRDLVKIEGTVIEKTMSNTKLRFIHIPRGNYQRLYFYKLPYSMLRINLIQFDGLVDERKEIEGLRQTTLW